MKKIGFIFGAILMCSFCYAQKAGQFGLNYSTGNSNSSIGSTYHFTDHVALRSNLTFSYLENNSVYYLKSTSQNYGLNLTGLYFLSTEEGVTPYLLMSAGYYFTRNSNEYLATRQNINGLDTTYSSYTYTGKINGYGLSFGGSFGLQYALSKRFSVFGEAGLVYNYTKNKSSDERTEQVYLSFSISPNVNSISNSQSISFFTAGIGFIFYLNSPKN